MEDRVVDLRDGMVGSGSLMSADDSGAETMAERVASLEGENAELRLQLAVFAVTDPVTGLSNRIGLLDAIEMASHRLARMNEPFAVVITRFPQLATIVDDDDHLEAVRDLAAILAAGLRNVDRVGRIDSTTFVSVLANIGFEYIEAVMSRTQASIQAMTIAADVPEKALASRVIALSITEAKIPVVADALLERCVEMIGDPTSAEITSLSP